MAYILALDQGTTSSRAIVFSEDGEATAVAQREFKQHFPQPGWVEHDAGEIWDTQLAVAKEVLEKAKIAAADIAGIGITNQRETTVVWDCKSGEPIHPAIVWQDRRTADFCDELRRDGFADLIREKTGLEIDAYFSASKLRWILDHVAGARSRAGSSALAFGTIDSWLLWKLTGGAVHATDVTNASRTMLMNLHEGGWDTNLLELFNIPRKLLPTVSPSSGAFGMTDPKLFGKPIPITGIAGDQQAALFGQCCHETGMVKNTYGTGCFMLMNVGDKPAVSKHGLLSTAGWRIGARTTYAVEGSVFVGGAVVQWLRDGLGIIEKSSDVEKLAASVPDTGGVHFVPAFVGLGAPQWDSYARGLIAGLTRGTTAAHIARAALEGIAHQVADLLEVMRKDAAAKPVELRVDGGAAGNDLLMQFQADLLGIPVARPKITETTALGAAYLAGLGAGVWSHPRDLKQHWKLDRVFEPKMGADEVAHRRHRWAEAVERSRRWESSAGDF